MPLALADLICLPLICGALKRAATTEDVLDEREVFSPIEAQSRTAPRALTPLQSELSSPEVARPIFSPPNKRAHRRSLSAGKAEFHDLSGMEPTDSIAAEPKQPSHTRSKSSGAFTIDWKKKHSRTGSGGKPRLLQLPSLTALGGESASASSASAENSAKLLWLGEEAPRPDQCAESERSTSSTRPTAKKHQHPARHQEAAQREERVPLAPLNRAPPAERHEEPLSPHLRAAPPSVGRSVSLPEQASPPLWDEERARARSRNLSQCLSRLPNKNLPSEYVWAASVLEGVCLNRPRPVADLASGAAGVPLFLVAGACPGAFCGMQAVLYSLMGGPADEPEAVAAGTAAAAVDFWWIKPKPLRPSQQAATLDRHNKGPHKNDPGKSKAMYSQFADLFSVEGSAAARERSERSGGGLLRFGVAVVRGAGPRGEPTRRAYVEQVEGGERYYVYLVWQEDFTTNPFARSRFIRGKLVYQRDPAESRYFERPFSWTDGVLSVPAGGVGGTEEPMKDFFPPDELKLGCGTYRC